MRIGHGRSCFPQCLFKEGYLSGPGADCMFPGCISVHLLRVRRRLTSPRWRSYSCTRVNFTRTTWDLGSTSRSCLTQFSLGCQVCWKTPLDVIFGFGSRWGHNTATLAAARNIRLYGETQTCQQMKRRSRPETWWILVLTSSGQSRNLFFLVRLLVDSTRFLTLVIPPLRCVQLSPSAADHLPPAP